MKKRKPKQSLRVEEIKTDLGLAKRLKDQRPIDKYHRWYREDAARGVAEANCRGINHDQFTVADRLWQLFTRAYACAGRNFSETIRQKHLRGQCSQTEQMMQAVHDYQGFITRVSQGSKAIAEAVCCHEVGLTEYEQQHGWRKGYAIIRLREALDELIYARKNSRKTNC